MKNKLGTKEKVAIMMLSVLVLFIVVFVAVMVRSTRPYKQAKTEAVELAKQYGKVTSTSDYYYFNRKSTFYAVKGKNASGQTLYTVIPEDGKEITVVNEKDGISDTKAMQTALNTGEVATITKVGLGQIKKELVWEITGKDTNGAYVYVLINYKDGKVSQTINDI